ncbi:MAG: response regulator [Ignavibacteriales bacterium]|nr:response regulator [Ignavibacteriales bacterium]
MDDYLIAGMTSSMTDIKASNNGDPKRMIAVLLADDHAAVRQGFIAALDQVSGVEVVGEAGDGEEAVGEAKRLKPDVVIMDISMPKMDGITAAKFIKDALPETKIVALSMHDDKRYIMDALDAGLDGYLLKTTRIENVRKAVLAIADGESYFDRSITRTLLSIQREESESRERARMSAKIDLSDDDLDLVRLTVEGFTLQEIGDKLEITPSAVKYRRKRLLEKLALVNTAELIKFGIMIGL